MACVCIADVPVPAELTRQPVHIMAARTGKKERTLRDQEWTIRRTVIENGLAYDALSCRRPVNGIDLWRDMDWLGDVRGRNDPLYQRKVVGRDTGRSKDEV